MAVYRCSVSIISRGDGRSAVAAAAIRAAETLRDERHGRRCRSPATNPAPVHAEILTPGHAPAWMRDRECLWNAVEAARLGGASQHGPRRRRRSDARVDHRSLEAQRQEALQRGDHAQARVQGRLPQPKLGRRAAELERQGITTKRGDLLRDTEEYNRLTQQLYALHDRLEALQAQSDPASAAGQS